MSFKDFPIFSSGGHLLSGEKQFMQFWWRALWETIKMIFFLFLTQRRYSVDSDEPPSEEVS